MNHHTRFAAALLAVLCAAASGCVHSRGPDPVGFAMDYVWRGDIDQIGIEEPSGAVIHPHRGTLFIVGDEGTIHEMTLDGEPIASRILEAGADYEGVTCDPTTGLLYLAEEGEERIVEVDPEGLTMRRRFPIERTFEGELRLDPGGEGIEAITFIPDPQHPEGGQFLVGNQAYTLDNPADPSALMIVEVPLRTGGERKHVGRITRIIELPVIDIAALHYIGGGEVFVSCDGPNLLLRVDLAAEAGERIRGAWALVGDEQEGLAMIDGEVFVAQDTGGVIRFGWDLAE